MEDIIEDIDILDLGPEFLLSLDTDLIEDESGHLLVSEFDEDEEVL